MKEEELACKTKRRFKATTDSRHNKPVADNLLELAASSLTSWEQENQHAFSTPEFRICPPTISNI